MKRLTLLILLLCGSQPLLAQENGIEQPFDLVTLPGGGKIIRWYGYAGRSYFVQVSDSNDHLKKWHWAPVIESGNDEEISYEVDGTADKGFFRLKYTDQVPDSGDTLDTADFDGDGISNLDEISPPQASLAMRGALPQPNPTATDPLNSDTDADGLTDGWERDRGTDPNDPSGSNGAAGDPDGDGLSNAEEYQNGTDPNSGDSDDDGVSDFNEVANHTNPNDPNDTPVEKFFWLRSRISQINGTDREFFTTCDAQSEVDSNCYFLAYRDNWLPVTTRDYLTPWELRLATVVNYKAAWNDPRLTYSQIPDVLDCRNLSTNDSGWSTSPSTINNLASFYSYSAQWGQFNGGAFDWTVPIPPILNTIQGSRSKIKLASNFIQDSDRTFCFMKSDFCASTLSPNFDDTPYRVTPVQVVIPKGHNVSRVPESNGTPIEVFTTNPADEIQADASLEFLAADAWVDLVPVEIQVRDFSHGVNGILGWPNASELKVNKWKEAFAENKQPRADFIEDASLGSAAEQEDKFRIRLPIKGLSEADRTVFITSSGAAEGEYNDKPTKVVLSPSPDGVSAVSKPMILVADTVDNTFNSDDLDDDQTHIVALGESLEIRHKSATGQLIGKIPVLKKKTVNLDVKILWQGKDTDIDPPPDLANQVKEDIKVAREIFTQAGVYLNVTTNHYKIDDPDIDLHDNLLLNPKDQTLLLAPEGQKLLDQYKRVATQNDVVCLYLQSLIIDDTGIAGHTLGISIPLNEDWVPLLPTGHTVPWSDPVSTACNGTFLIAGCNPNLTKYTLAHELGHCLNLLHTDDEKDTWFFDDPYNFMTNTNGTYKGYTNDSKRMRNFQQERIFKSKYTH